MTNLRKRELSCAALLVALVGGCQEREVNVQVRSLARSGDVAYVCRLGRTGPGVPLSECHRASLEEGTHALYALVTQTSTGEVALINVPIHPSDRRSDEGVVDIDPSVPGYGFLRVGAQPGDIVASPDGEATFVTSRDIRRPGIFALPTSCLGPPSSDQTPRDITTWSACSLPTPPGSMSLVFDPLDANNACESTLRNEPARSDEAGRECPANLLTARGSAGRWKLLVALPDSGSVAVIDAQSILDREPGTFGPCPVDVEYPLSVELPAVPPEQRVPEDLQGCPSSPPPARPAPPVFSAHPVDMAVSGGVAYLADDRSPVIHRLGVSHPCQATEMPPLLPMSFDNPGRTVTTSKVAVSPLTPGGKRFVYAVDELDLPLSSVMVFDVSPGVTDRTPLVRPGSSYIPGETADRLRFGGAVQDITFLLRDRPLTDPQTGTAVVGTMCNPNPDPGAPGTEYQPNRDFTEGAQADELRGVFAMALLSNGQISVVDVEDFDAPCRRPADVNTSSEIDFRGCQNDEPPIAGFSRYAFNGDTPELNDDIPTVTNEVSCRMVQPHRQRSAFLGISSDLVGVRAPSLRSFPQIAVPESELGRSFVERPKLLAVDFPGVSGPPEPSRVYIGTTLYQRSTGGPLTNELVIDPARAEQYSVALPFIEPRAYTSELAVLTYEGVVAAFGSGQLEHQEGESTLILNDRVNFCDRGVNDIELMRELGARRFQLEGDALEAFAEKHADVLVLTGDFPDEDDRYWSDQSECTRAACMEMFGEFDADDIDVSREFRVIDANQERLVLAPRFDADLALADCCFPSATAYQIRASSHWVLSGSLSGVQHDVVARAVTTPSGERVFECVRDCSPRKRWNDPRVFEITCPEDSPGCAVAGPSTAGDVCVLEERDDTGFLRPNGVELDEPAARCIHGTPTARFAVYRGLQPSARGTVFSWAVSSGFQPFGLDLSGLATAVAPQSAVALPDLDWFTVVDGASLGLVQIELENLSVLTPTIN